MIAPASDTTQIIKSQAIEPFPGKSKIFYSHLAEMFFQHFIVIYHYSCVGFDTGKNKIFESTVMNMYFAPHGRIILGANKTIRPQIGAPGLGTITITKPGFKDT